MKNKIKKFIVKSDSGIDIGDSLLLFVTLLTCTMICLIGIISYANLDRSDDVRLIARQYMLAMETTGYLTDTQKESMIEDLTSVGVINGDYPVLNDDWKTWHIENSQISFAGTTMEPVTYGEEIVLNVKCLVMTRETVLTGFHISIKDTARPMNIKMKSTAKC